MNIEIDKKLLTSLLVMGTVVEARDAYTGGHLWRVGQFSRMLAEAAGLDRDGVFLASIGGFLHDLGKIGVPDAILTKPGKLSDGEYAIIKSHPTIGNSVLSEHPLAPLALDAVTYHHERADGSGYPNKLVGDEIPLMARIVAISDAFDAMTSTRAYRKGMSLERAFDLLERGTGSQFDAQLTRHFLHLGKAGRLDGIVGHSHHGHHLSTCPACGPIIATHGLADGARYACRACGGEFLLHKKGDGFELEHVGMADAEMQRIDPDMAPIRELIDLA